MKSSVITGIDVQLAVGMRASARVGLWICIDVRSCRILIVTGLAIGAGLYPIKNRRSRPREAPDNRGARI
jgi:hypothetical protein